MTHSKNLNSVCVSVNFSVLSLCIYVYMHRILELFGVFLIATSGCLCQQDCVGCKRCETACPTDFLSIRRGIPETTDLNCQKVAGCGRLWPAAMQPEKKQVQIFVQYGCTMLYHVVSVSCCMMSPCCSAEQQACACTWHWNQVSTCRRTRRRSTAWVWTWLPGPLVQGRTSSTSREPKHRNYVSCFTTMIFGLASDLTQSGYVKTFGKPTRRIHLYHFLGEA